MDNNGTHATTGFYTMENINKFLSNTSSINYSQENNIKKKFLYETMELHPIRFFGFTDENILGNDSR